MKTGKILRAAALFTSLTVCLSSCMEDADPGPLQETEEEYAINDFDRLEIGDAFDVRVEQGATYTVKVKGDRRNVGDLEVKKISNTLQVRFRKGDRNDYRQYTTYITITMPSRTIHSSMARNEI